MKHLVVVIPGIGGSELADDTGPVWRAGLGDLLLPIRHDRLSLSTNPTLHPRGLVTTKAVGSKKNELPWLPGWTVVHGYETMFDQLQAQLPGARVDYGNQGGDPMATVVGFPYDFRQSVAAIAERLNDEVETRLTALGAVSDEERKHKVIFVAHSMGGLVARYLLGPLGRASWCRSLITLGTPHRGAPKALDLLVNGARVGPLILGGLTNTMREWPALHELMPTYKAIGRLDPDDPEKTPMVGCYPSDLDGVSESFKSKSAEAAATHEDITEAWKNIRRVDAPELVAMYGFSHQTQTSATLNPSTNELVLGNRHPSWLSAAGWEELRGDGTVPAVAATPLEMAASVRNTDRLDLRHGPISGAPEAVALICQYEHVGTTEHVRGDSDGTVAVGLEIEDAYVQGTDATIAADIFGLEERADTTGANVWGKLVDPEGTAREVRLEHAPEGEAAHRYQFSVDLEMPGTHRVTVSSSGIPGMSDRSLSDAFHVVPEE